MFDGRAGKPPLLLLRAPQKEAPGGLMQIDAATRRNLEITETLRGEPAPTLFSLLDECATGMGSRVGDDPISHPDTAILAMLLAA